MLGHTGTDDVIAAVAAWGRSPRARVTARHRHHDVWQQVRNPTWRCRLQRVRSRTACEITALVAGLCVLYTGVLLGRPYSRWALLVWAVGAVAYLALGVFARRPSHCVCERCARRVVFGSTTHYEPSTVFLGDLAVALNLYSRRAVRRAAQSRDGWYVVTSEYRGPVHELWIPDVWEYCIVTIGQRAGQAHATLDEPAAAVLAALARRLQAATDNHDLHADAATCRNPLGYDTPVLYTLAGPVPVDVAELAAQLDDAGDAHAAVALARAILA